MEKKDDKVGKKTAKKNEKKRERERSNRFAKKKSPNFGFCACVKNKMLFNYVRLVGKYVFFSRKTLFFAMVMLISRKLVQERGIGGKRCFFATRRRSPKG